MEKTHFQLGEDEIVLSSSLPKTLSKLERKYLKKLQKIARGSFGEVSRCRRMSRRLALFLFHRRFMIAFSIFAVWTIGWYSTASQKYSGFAYWNVVRSESLRRIAKCAWQCSSFNFFILFSLFVHFST
ncbi:hypothetical protein H5410_045772 [Solanum commersonii]|uniref:Uncharacterized protein n=1 Tax=Solanum commersonii TaxID=4109 RepID=A0A9J5XC78_SOLCO|nr:hypothetical protein H5410_045772 [Solanum commersonii]